ncbi:hypothetical protein B0T16DRAFT_458959 [Cercophora newfieldiana]|uniref:Uncharacterized protein n=1 Tax=Cercophora newfieldiana TaxID=92897 RepID=A0AA39Y8Y8_9PEZI|nr:hypothetical protein B0T16DRAFT_458959 [Cercophora newfieldiana]
MTASLPEVTGAQPTTKFGEEGQNTIPLPEAHFPKRITAPDGFSMIDSTDMYRIDELHPGRREPHFPNLHNLHSSVIARTINPPATLPSDQPAILHRASLWDKTASAVRSALATLPPNTHIAICANSGPYNPTLETLPPSAAVPAADYGLLFVAQFRRPDGHNEAIHPNWIQIAVPITPAEGRLLAGLRLLPAVTTSRPDLTYTITNLTYPTVAKHHMRLVRDSGLPYGSVLNSWKPTNLGCFFHVSSL